MDLHRLAALAALLLVAGPAGLADPAVTHARAATDTPMSSCGNHELLDGSHVEVKTYAAPCATARRVLSRYSLRLVRCRTPGCSWHTGRWSCWVIRHPAGDRRERFGCLGWDEYIAAYTMRGRVTL